MTSLRSSSTIWRKNVISSRTQWTDGTPYR
nr:MAG TPA: hypothetical protein [Caudoviricetes sp.]